MRRLLAASILILGANCSWGFSTTLRMGLTAPSTGQFDYPQVIDTMFHVIDSSTAIQGAANTFTSSNTFTGAASTVTVAQDLKLSYIGTSQCLATDSNNNVVGQACGSGGNSSLGVFNGTSGAPGVAVSSPTSAINFLSGVFGVALQGPATAYITPNVSSITLQGNSFNGANQLTKTDGSGHLPTAVFNNGVILSTETLQSGATFYTSSGTANSFSASTATVYTLLQVNGTGQSGTTVVGQIKGSAFNVLANGNIGLGTAVPGFALDEQQGTANFKFGIAASTVAVSSITANRLVFGDASVQTTAAIPGVSMLAISSGSATNSVVVSSPTLNVVFDSNTFTTSLQGSATSFITVRNTVTSLTGTANQVNVSASSGAVTLSTPQSIDTNAIVNFQEVILSNSVVTPLVAAQTGNDLTLTPPTGHIVKVNKNLSMENNGIINLANGSGSSDAAAYGQVIHLTSSLQSGATFYVSSGTVSGNLSVSSLTLTSTGLQSTILATNASGVIISTTVSSGSGSGTVNSGNSGNAAFYTGATTVSDGFTAGGFRGAVLMPSLAQSTTFNYIDPGIATAYIVPGSENSPTHNSIVGTDNKGNLQTTGTINGNVTFSNPVTFSSTTVTQSTASFKTDPKAVYAVYVATNSPGVANTTTLLSVSTQGAVAIGGGALDMGSHKITSLTNGSASSDAAAFGQLPVFSVLCSSSVSISSTTTSSSFVPSYLGCTATLSNATHHFYIAGNMYLNNNTTTDASCEAVFEDGANLDAATLGQCEVNATVTGLSSIGATCPLVEYLAGSDTSAHAFRVYFDACGAGTAVAGNGTTARFIVFEVP